MEKEIKEEHPSYGMLQISRVSISPSTPLFGSSIMHHEMIALRIEHAAMSRHLNRHWYYGRDQIIEVNMSYSQFMRAIMSLNTTGVPVTISRLEGKPIEQKKDLTSTKELFQKDIQRSINRTLSISREACKSIDEILKSSKPISAAQKKELQSLLYSINQDLESNINFVGKSFEEQMDKTITEAHGEIEAFFDSKIHSLGIEALQKELIELPNISEADLVVENEEDD